MNSRFGPFRDGNATGYSRPKADLSGCGKIRPPGRALDNRQMAPGLNLARKHQRMIFGEKHDFAIEAMVEPNLVLPSSVWGRMRVWCAGVPLGDFAEPHCGLPSSPFKSLCLDLPELWDPEFERKSDEELFNHLDAVLYGFKDGVEVADERTLEECEDDARAYSRFSFLTNWGEMFDREGKSFIFCADGDSVNVLNRPIGSTQLRCLRTSAVSVQAACSEFMTWFEQELTKLRPPSALRN